MDAAEQTEMVLTAVALVEARLEGRDNDLSYLLDYCTNHRAVAVVLADALAQCLRGEFGGEAGEALGQLRSRVLGGGSHQPRRDHRGCGWTGGSGRGQPR